LKRLFQTKRDAPFDRIDLENLNVDFLAGRNDLAWMHVLLGP